MAKGTFFTKLLSKARKKDGLTMAEIRRFTEEARETANDSIGKGDLTLSNAEKELLKNPSKTPSRKTPQVKAKSEEKGPKAQARIKKEGELQARMNQKDFEKNIAKEGTPREKALVGAMQARRVNRKDFEAKVDVEEKGRGAYRIAADFRAKEAKKQQANYERQYARSIDPTLTAAERRAAKKEMAKLDKRFVITKAFKKEADAKMKAKMEREAKKEASLDKDVAKLMAALNRRAPKTKAAAGGYMKKNKGSMDYRKGGLLISSVDNKKKR